MTFTKIILSIKMQSLPLFPSPNQYEEEEKRSSYNILQSIVKNFFEEQA